MLWVAAPCREGITVHIRVRTRELAAWPRGERTRCSKVPRANQSFATCRLNTATNAPRCICRKLTGPRCRSKQKDQRLLHHRFVSSTKRVMMMGSSSGRELRVPAYARLACKNGPGIHEQAAVALAVSTWPRTWISTQHGVIFAWFDLVI